ncbi:MAG: hypothetical protein HC897_20020, partial [Thermoanaerobaculia bacterium]|nr:hypothetical protein [Thermoanaerobaculia bacterium]
MSDEWLLAIDPQASQVDVVALGSGEAVVLWRSWNSAMGQHVLRGRSMSLEGHELGAVFEIIPTEPAVWQWFEACGQPGQHFLLAWTGDRKTILAQRFDLAGLPDTEMPQVVAPEETLQLADLACSADGRAVIAWRQRLPDTTVWDEIRVQRLDAEGNLLGPQLIPFRPHRAPISAPLVGILRSGELAVFWNGVARFYDAAGDPLTVERPPCGQGLLYPDIVLARAEEGYTLINAIDGQDQQAPDVYVAYPSDSPSIDLWPCLADRKGRLVGPPSSPYALPGGQAYPYRIAAAADADGNFLATWPL